MLFLLPGASLSTFFFFNDPAPTELYTLSLHDALPISSTALGIRCTSSTNRTSPSSRFVRRSEEHTSELQSRVDLVCRLLLEKKKKRKSTPFSVKKKK